MSKDVLHKQLNFIHQSDQQDNQEQSLYTGKNYAINLVRHVCKRNINIIRGI